MSANIRDPDESVVRIVAYVDAVVVLQESLYQVVANTVKVVPLRSRLRLPAVVSVGAFDVDCSPGSALLATELDEDVRELAGLIGGRGNAVVVRLRRIDLTKRCQEPFPPTRKGRITRPFYLLKLCNG